MTSLSCDYCGEPIDPDQPHLKFTLSGMLTSRRVYEPDWGHYHADDRECWWRFREALETIEHTARAATLDAIPVATPQKIAALRRRHVHVAP